MSKTPEQWDAVLVDRENEIHRMTMNIRYRVRDGERVGGYDLDRLVLYAKSFADMAGQAEADRIEREAAERKEYE